MVLKELIFNSFHFGEDVVVLKVLILTIFTLGGAAVLKVLNFNSFYFCRCVVALKELIFNSFYFGEGMVL